MKTILIFLMLILSSTAHAKCLYNIPIRVDNNFVYKDKRTIVKALRRWHIVSGKKICFSVREDSVSGTELLTYKVDGTSTIYSGGQVWQRDVARFVHDCHLGSSCIAITIRGKNETSDIFVVKRTQFLNLIIHEVGHLLGFGHSVNKNDIMYGYIHKKFMPFSKNDKDVLKCLMKNKRVTYWDNNCVYGDWHVE